jgi:serine phosphatase RsbU (regulator of sigma subunit)
VCGKGVGAGTQSLQFAGALGGLIGSLPPLGLFSAANDFLLRQHWEEGFATAVHVLVDLKTGNYSVVNAGHPPAMRWVHGQSQWQVDSARGTALGVLERPDFHRSAGVIAPGDALMFYTDGVVESRSRDVVSGIDWLRATAGRVVMSDGFDGAPRRILSQVPGGDDDRAVLVLDRERPLVDYGRGRQA